MIENKLKLIALFMGATELDETSGLLDPSKCLNMVHPIRPDGIEYISLTELKYDTSWDWIMPVVGKIGDLEFSEKEGLEEYMNKKFVNEFGIKIHIYCTITQVFNAVVKFIEWYNKNVVINM